MRLRPEQILYVRSMGKALRVTAVFTTSSGANKYMESHRDEGVVAEFKHGGVCLILLANMHDQGVAIAEGRP